MLYYIDPGTGSMLFTIIIGAASAGIYALRKALVKARFVMSGGKQEKADDERRLIAMFSDNKRYWNVFKPICDELERRGMTASYLTASPDDPALDAEYNHVTCEFIGEGNKAFARLNMLKADIVVSTTPGLDVYQWKRSRDVKWYVHVFHAVGDVTLYRIFGLDYYDAVLLSGRFQEAQIRQLEQLRGLPAKEIALGGLPHMDALQKQLQDAGPAPEHPTTVLLAPSWGAGAILSKYGGSIIDALLKTGYHIIVRPHPQSFASETELMDRLMSEHPESEQLEWNRDNDNFEVLRRSDIMVSDFSGVVYDFAFIFDRPVIYTEPNLDKSPYDAWWLDEEIWIYESLSKFGRQLSMDDPGQLKQMIDECLTETRFREGRDAARDEGWACQGHAAATIVDYLQAKLEELSEPTEAEQPAEAPTGQDSAQSEEATAGQHSEQLSKPPDEADAE